MDNEIQLISDGDGLAVIGEEKAVERFLREEGLWAASKALDLRGLKPLLTHGSNRRTLQGQNQPTRPTGQIDVSAGQTVFFRDDWRCPTPPPVFELYYDI